MLEKESKSKTIEVSPADIPLASDGLGVPVFFADQIRGSMVTADTTKLTFIQHRINALTNDVVALPVATLIVPTSQLRSWGQYFARLAEREGREAISEAKEEQNKSA